MNARGCREIATWTSKKNQPRMHADQRGWKRDGVVFPTLERYWNRAESEERNGEPVRSRRITLREGAHGRDVAIVGCPSPTIELPILIVRFRDIMVPSPPQVSSPFLTSAARKEVTVLESPYNADLT